MPTLVVRGCPIAAIVMTMCRFADYCGRLIGNTSSQVSREEGPGGPVAGAAGASGFVPFECSTARSGAETSTNTSGALPSGLQSTHRM